MKEVILPILQSLEDKKGVHPCLVSTHAITRAGEGTGNTVPSMVILAGDKDRSSDGTNRSRNQKSQAEGCCP